VVVEVTGCGDGGLLLRPTGELCVLGLEPLEKAFEAALDVGGSEIRIDLSDVRMVSAAAVWFFLRASAACADCRVRFVLQNVDGMNLKVLELLDAAHLVEHWAAPAPASSPAPAPAL
jgi:anti-anti-sigma regulatory factor